MLQNNPPIQQAGLFVRMNAVFEFIFLKHGSFVKCHYRNNTRGNALFLILIAVALFAALAYAMTSSDRAAGSISKDKAILIAGQMQSYAASIETAITRMKLVNGCTDTQISFENTVVTGYTNGNAPLDKRCHVFDPAGGAITWQNPPAGSNDGSDYMFTGYMSFHAQNPSTTVPVADAIDLVMILPYITSDICLAINRNVGLTAPLDRLYIFVNAASKFVGTYVWGHNYHSNPISVVRPSVCMIPSVNSSPVAAIGKLHFMHALIQR